MDIQEFIRQYLIAQQKKANPQGIAQGMAGLMGYDPVGMLFGGVPDKALNMLGADIGAMKPWAKK
jgi:hypothetical protein